MPLYEYACNSCGSVIEVLQKMSDRPLRKCQKCSGRLEKLVSRTSFQLKGGGWYAQGYAKSGGGGGSTGSSDKKSKADKSTPSSGGESKKSETKSEASPAVAATA